MGYTTYFQGQIDITPPLNEAEATYLQKFAETRRMDRAQGDYYVGNSDEGINDNNSPGEHMPGLWCQWAPTEDRDGIAWDEGEKFYEADQWMVYIIDHFLKPGAEASKSDDPQFADFTFDHACSGEILAEGEDSDDHWRIRVVDNEVFVDQGVVSFSDDTKPRADSAAMDEIHDILSGEMWSADHLGAIADVVRATGREILPPTDDDFARAGS